LTYEQLLEFHREYYHPSRCLFFFYGNLPLVKHLNFIEKELERAEKMAPLPPFPLQTRFEKPVQAVDFFPVAAGEEQKDWITFAWLTVPLLAQGELLALEVINAVLTDTDASPLTKALIQTGLCTDVDSALDGEMSEIPWVITCKGCKEKSAEKLQKTLFDTLNQVVFRAEEVEAALHQLEFERTEIGGEGGPFGLTLFMRGCLIKQHGSEPENALLIHSLFEELKGRVKDPKYLPGLLRKYVIDNPHFVRLILKPDPDLNRKEQEEEAERLKKIHFDKKALEEQSAQLKAYQEEAEHQSLDCLPKVTLKDVPAHLRDYPLVQKKNVFHHSCFTNQIVYADLVFELPEIAVEDLPLVSLFAQILPELGCGGRSYEENLAFQQRYIGEFAVALALHVSHDDPDVCRPTLALRGKALQRNVDKLFQLFSDVVHTPNFKEKARIKEWLAQHATEQKDRLTRAAMSYAIQTSLKGLSIPAFIHEQWNGLSYYNAVMQWEKKFDPAQLARMGKLLLGANNAEWIFSADQIPEGKLPVFEGHTGRPWTGKYDLPKPEPQARFIAAPVAFTSLGMRTISVKDPASPLLFVATELMKNVFLHKEIREKGGAYGGGASYSPAIGNFYFYAYRDPNLQS
ncbi:MAG: insulinase family protein, partial [Verrucomicrobia bacterium]|nr:insulinase family protein [Verrucomicrobiota bacterium]